MARKRYKPEEIVAKLRQVDVLVSQGQNMVDAIRQIGVRQAMRRRDYDMVVTVPASSLSRIFHDEAPAVADPDDCVCDIVALFHRASSSGVALRLRRSSRLAKRLSSSFAFICTRLSTMADTLARWLQATEYNNQAGSVIGLLLDEGDHGDDRALAAFQVLDNQASGR
jgi:hypothetical protein